MELGDTDNRSDQRRDRIAGRVKANFLASYARYWQRRISPDAVERAFPSMPEFNAINAMAVAAVALIILAVVADPFLRAFVRIIDPQFKQLFLDWQIIGKSSWMLTVTGILSLVLLAIGLSSADMRRRLRCLHVATISGYVFWAVALPGILVAVIKQVVGRTRPFAAGENAYWDLVPWSGYEHASFPSGDACNAGAFAMALGLLFPQYRPAFAAYAVLVAFGRVISERHFLTDVCAGLFIGALGAFLLALWLARRGHVFKVTKSGALRLRGNRIFS